MIIAAQLTYPESAPIALGGTTDAALVTASQGQISARVLAGSVVIQCLRWLPGIGAWERLEDAGLPVSITPDARTADGVSAREFEAGQAYYAALITTAPPDGSLVNLAGVDISNAASASSGGGGGLMDVTAGAHISVTTPAPGVRQVAALVTRPARTLWVGLPLDGAIPEDGAAYAPYSDMQAALDWCEAYALANPGEDTFHIHASPGVLADFTVPPDLSFDLKSSVSGQGATVEKVTLTAGRSAAEAQVIFEGWELTGSASFEFAANPAPLAGDAVTLVLKDSAAVSGSILNPAGPGVGAIFLSVGLLDPRALAVSIHINGEIDLDETSFAVLYQTDFAQRLAAGALYITACKCSQQIECYGTEVQLKDLERGGAFPYGAPTVTFLGAPGVVTCDAVSLVAFGEAGGKVVNGSIVAPGFFVTYPSDGGVAIAAGVPVKVVSGVASVVGTTEADMLALSGYTLTASSGAPDERVLVVGVGGQITGVFTGLTPGEAQYVAGGAIIAASALSAYIAGAASGSWYRRIGVARTANLIENDFGEPQQVP